MKARPARGDLDVALLGPQLERDLTRRQAADDVGEQPPGKQHAAIGGQIGIVERPGQRQLHVGGAKGERTVTGREQDAAERRQRAARGNGATDELEGGGQ